MRTSDLAVKLAAIKVVKEAVAEAEADTKDALSRALDPGDRKGAVIDGESVGTISYSKTSAKAVVTDRAAFTKWATDAYPTEVRVTVTADADELMAAMNYAAHRTDDIGPFNRVMAKIQSTEPTVNAAWEKKILAEVVKAKEPVDTTTGEMIPGVEYVPGGQPGYVSVRVSEDQREALLAAHNDRRLDDLLVLVTTPAELEA